MPQGLIFDVWNFVGKIFWRKIMTSSTAHPALWLAQGHTVGQWQSGDSTPLHGAVLGQPASTPFLIPVTQAPRTMSSGQNQWQIRQLNPVWDLGLHPFRKKLETKSTSLGVNHLLYSSKKACKWEIKKIPTRNSTVNWRTEHRNICTAKDRATYSNWTYFHAGGIR